MTVFKPTLVNVWDIYSQELPNPERFSLVTEGGFDYWRLDTDLVREIMGKLPSCRIEAYELEAPEPEYDLIEVAGVRYKLVPE